jgi:hypothetical protein
VLSDTTSPSDQDHGSGLWLWHGKAPLTPSPPQPAPRARQILGPNVSGLRRRGWMALPGGVALALLAVILLSTPLDKPSPADTPVAVEPVPSPAEAHAAIPAPRVEHTDTQLDQAQMPSAPAAPLPARGTEHELATKAVHHTSARTVRKTHTFAGRNSPFVIHGVLTPPDPTVRHDGGH